MSRYDDEDDKLNSLGRDVKSRVENSENTKCINKDFGVCNNCKRFFYLEYELGAYEAYCARFEESGMVVSRSHTKRIIKCNGFIRDGQMSLWDMQNIAWNLNASKDIKGFQGRK